MFAFLVTARNRMLARKWWSGDHGATAVEYGLMAGLIAAVIVVAVTAVGTQTVALFAIPPEAWAGVGAATGP